jgi:hypothetical protein
VSALIIISIETQINATHRWKEVDKMLTNNEQKTLERLGRMMQNMNDMQKAQLCAFTEGLAMALERKGA